MARDAAKRKASKAKYRATEKGRQKHAAATAAWYEANKEKISGRRKSAYAENAEAEKEARRKYRLDSAEKARASVAKWAAKNANLRRAACRKYQAAKLSAVPSWADKVVISQYYMFARFLTEATGIPWEVDHIIPLRSKLVCGLHVQNNLTFMPAAWNAKKGNKLIELPTESPHASMHD